MFTSALTFNPIRLVLIKASSGLNTPPPVMSASSAHVDFSPQLLEDNTSLGLGDKGLGCHWTAVFVSAL